MKSFCVGVKKRGRKKKSQPPIPQKTSPVKITEKLEKPVKIKEEPLDDIDVIKESETGIKEPETGQEPQGPDQNLPTPSEPVPPSERKATSYINVRLVFSFTFISSIQNFFYYIVTIF